MNPHITRTIWRKELLDTLRDKRTLIMMLGVPLLLYPAITLLSFQGLLLLHGHLEETPSRVAIFTQAPGPLADWVAASPQIELIDSARPMRDLQEGRLDAVVFAAGDLHHALAERRRFKVEIRYDATEIPSREAAARLSSVLRTRLHRIRADRLAEINLSPAFVTPFEVGRKDVAPPQKTTGVLVGTLLPVFMVIMLAVGAFYPAVDLTAGEKERGTFETLLATPASKLEIVAGKFGAVFMLAMVTGLLNMASMGLTLAFVFMQIPPELQQRMGMTFNYLPLSAFALIVAVMVPLAFFIAAAMMAVAVLARSFKEAQNLMMPLFLLVMLPSMLPAVPGAELGSGLELVPIGNVALLFKELLTGNATLNEVFIVFVSTAVLAIPALLMAVWLFQREEVVLSEERGLPITLRRAHYTPRAALPPGTAVGYFAVVMLLLFYVGTLAQQWDMVSGLLITQWGLLLLPTLAVLWYVRVDLRTALHLRGMTGRSAAGVLLATIAWPVLAIQASFWFNQVLPAPENYVLEFTRVMEEATQQAGAPLMLFALAVSVCEEVLFRGALLSGLRQRMGGVACVLIVAILFGLFHLSIYRFFPTALTGAFLTYLVWRTGSLAASIFAHGVFNAALFSLQLLPMPEYLASCLDAEKIASSGFSLGVLLAATAVFLAGLLVIGRPTFEHLTRPQE